jgi:hypothetical protein
MRHAHTRTLLEYWRSRREGAAAPQRADIAPQDLSDFLGQLFILKRIDSGHHVFRLAGTRLCALYQREFRDQNFLSLWRGHDGEHVKALLEGAIHRVAPAAASARAIAIDGRTVAIELAFLPLRGQEGQIDRILGLYQPLDDPDWLRGRPVVRTELCEARPAATPEPFNLRRRQAPAAPSFAANDR